MNVERDPAEAGFDAQRLARIDRHFQRYVDDGKLPGFLAVVARDGKVVHVARAGLRDVEAGLPVEPDTLWRIYSMTKPITSVAAMLLWEEGAFELKDPVARFIACFADMRVWRGGSQNKPVTVPATEPIRMWHLLTHTAGLTYGFHYAAPGRRDLPRARVRVGRAARASTWPRAATRGRSCRCSSSPAASGTTPSPPTCSAA